MTISIRFQLSRACTVQAEAHLGPSLIYIDAASNKNDFRSSRS